MVDDDAHDGEDTDGSMVWIWRSGEAVAACFDMPMGKLRLFSRLEPPPYV